MDKHSSLNSSVLTQTSAFLDGEGDNWFKRNRESLTSQSFSTEVLTRVLSNSHFEIQSILEIGCSNGFHLNELGKAFNAKCYGIDPSSAAISAGSKAFPSLNLSVGIGHNLNFNDESFDLIHFGFCLYLFDRSDIFQAIAEADRVLQSGGFLAITDFDPNTRQKNEYHHFPRLSSFKNSYSDFFTGGGHYSLIAKESFSHSNKYFTVENDERIATSILFKEPDPYQR
jgi:ubiquinone/menaquinone biosynthesis C-methylase UbiE